MNTETARAERVPPRYGNFIRPRRPGLTPWLDLTGTLVGLTLFAIVSMVMFLASFLAALATLPVAAGLWGLFLFHDQTGLTLGGRMSRRLTFRHATKTGSNVYRRGVFNPGISGHLTLPGIASQITVREAHDGLDRPFALIHMSASKRVAACFASSPEGDALVDHDTVDARVAGWGEWMAQFASDPDYVQGQVVLDASIDPGIELTERLTSQIDPAAPVLAREVLAATTRELVANSVKVRAYTTITWSAKDSKGKSRAIEDVAHDVGIKIPALAASLENTGAGVATYMTPPDLAGTIRGMCDPHLRAAIDSERYSGRRGIDWGQAGPQATDPRWKFFVHDSGLSVSYVMTKPPRGAVFADVLKNLLAPHRDFLAKRVCLLFRTHEMADAVSAVDYDQQSNRIDPSNGAAATMEARYAAQAAIEEASGAGVELFTLLVTVTVDDIRKLEAAQASLESLIRSARLSMVPAYGSQDSAFMLTMPLGLVTPTDLALPFSRRVKL